ncbi:hypothetical protein [Pseudoalteromonas piscicida]|uniref:hypothetical protein n=1 Tax=Pseudoalteromonas piscicida TaxID=43662 RepID=UPI0032C1B648
MRQNLNQIKPGENLNQTSTINLHLPKMHPHFNAVLSKEEYKKGLPNYLGQYGKCDIQITNIIEGLNAVTVEYLHPCVDQQGNKDEKDNKQKLMTLFEFSGEKIKRIRHYF